MVCNKCGFQVSNNAQFCPQCGNIIKNSEEKQNFSEGGFGERAKAPSGKAASGLLAILIVAIITVAALIGIFVIISSNIESQLEGSGQESVSVKHTAKKHKKSAKDKTDESEDEKYKEEAEEAEEAEEIEEPEEPEEEELEEAAEEITSEPGTIWASTGDGFDFIYGATDIVTNPDYRTVYDAGYQFYCDVPNHFIKDDTSGGVRFYAPDRTAVMDITAYINAESRTPKELMNEHIEALGGEVTYSASGETWFAVSVRKNGVSYYTKAFVDHYVREFSFDFPTEYEMYRDYVEYLEDHFKRIDQ